jgi:curli biogenesis system outer membrane secretion channel CsgG
VLPFLHVKLVEVVFENEISGADLTSWSVGTADRCGTGIALGSALVNNSQEEGKVQ